MNFRIINKQTLDEVKQLWNYCFVKSNKVVLEWYFNEYCIDKNNIIGGFNENNKLMTMIHLNSNKILVRGRILKIPFLFAIATNPVFRGKNLFKELFNMTVKILSSKGIPFVFIVPKYLEFFRKNEFAVTHFKTLYKLPLNELKVPKIENSSMELKLIKYDFNNTEKNNKIFTILDIIYKKNMINKHAYTIRNKLNWEKNLNNFININVKIVVVYEKNSAIGYLLYKIYDDKFKIIEMIVNNQFAKIKLLEFAKFHINQCKNLEWHTDANDLNYYYINNKKFAGQKTPFMMARVIDVIKALQLLNVESINSIQCGEIIILFKDSTIKENNILVKLVITKKKLEVKYTNAKPDVYLNVTSFVQLYFGTHSVEELVDNEFIWFENNDKIKLLASLFPKCNNYINEYY